MIGYRNRAAVKRRLVELAGYIGTVDLGADNRSAETIPVAYDLPPDDANQTCIYFGAAATIDGETSPSGLKRGQPKADDFTVAGVVDVYGLDSSVSADEAVERVLNAYEAILGRCQRLIDPDGVVPNGFETGEQCPYEVQFAYITTAQLEHGSSEGDTTGGRYRFTVRCQTQIRP